MKSLYIYQDSLAEHSDLILQSNLNEYLNYAYKTLFNKKKNACRYITEEDFIHSPDEIKEIQEILNFSLELIGTYSNKRFSQKAESQDNFFKRKGEIETFFLHLFISVQSHKAQKINLKEHPAPYINQDHLNFKKKENKNNNYFTYKGKNYTEKKLYASGIYYVIPFIIESLHQNDAIYTSRLLSRMSHFMNGIDYSLTISQKGGEKTVSGKNKEKETAYQLFCDNEIYRKYGPKHEPMIAGLQNILKEHGINRTIDTLKTSWIPDFVKRYKKS